MGVSEFPAYHEPQCRPKCKKGDFAECQRRNRRSMELHRFLRLPCLDAARERPAKSERQHRPNVEGSKIWTFLCEHEGEWLKGKVIAETLGIPVGTVAYWGKTFRDRGQVETSYRGYRVLIPADN